MGDGRLGRPRAVGQGDRSSIGTERSTRRPGSRSSPASTDGRPRQRRWSAASACSSPPASSLPDDGVNPSSGAEALRRQAADVGYGASAVPRPRQRLECLVLCTPASRLVLIAPRAAATSAEDLSGGSPGAIRIDRSATPPETIPAPHARAARAIGFTGRTGEEPDCECALRPRISSSELTDRTPFACSMRIRLCRALRSCSDRMT